MATLQGKTLFITGASRGIGLAIGAAGRARRRERGDRGQDGRAASQAAGHHPHGGRGDREGGRQGAGAPGATSAPTRRSSTPVEQAVETFGGIDVLVNNASAIFLAGTVETPMKRYDLMHQINTRGTFLCSQACIPHLKKADNPHILNLSPAAEHGREVVRAPRRLHDGEVRHEHVRAGHGTRSCAARASPSTRSGRAPRSPPRPSRTCSGARKPSSAAASPRSWRTPPTPSSPGHKSCDRQLLHRRRSIEADGVTDLEKYAVDPARRCCRTSS